MPVGGDLGGWVLKGDEGKGTASSWLLINTLSGCWWEERPLSWDLCCAGSSQPPDVFRGGYIGIWGVA